MMYSRFGNVGFVGAGAQPDANRASPAAVARSRNSRRSMGSERDDISDLGERADCALTYQTPQASFGEMFGSKSTVGQKVLVRFLSHDVSQPAIPLTPRWD